MGDLAPVEAAFALKQLIEGQGGIVECRASMARNCRPATGRPMWARRAIEDIDTADMILLIGTDPSVEAPVLNARIRKAWLAGAEVGVIGAAPDLTYEYFHAGPGRGPLVDMAAKGVSDHSRDAKKTVVIVGQGALTDEDGAAVLAHAMNMADRVGVKIHGAAHRRGPRRRAGRGCGDRWRSGRRAVDG